jgi:hypothetical protein
LPLHISIPNNAKIAPPIPQRVEEENACDSVATNEYMEALPFELICHIVKWMDLHDYHQLRRCSKSMNKMDEIPTLSFLAYTQSMPFLKDFSNNEYRMKLDFDFVNDRSFIFMANHGHTKECQRLLSGRKAYKITEAAKIEVFYSLIKAYKLTVSHNYSEDLIITLITDHSIDSNTEVSSGFIESGTVLHWASFMGHVRLLTLLLKDPKVNIMKAEGVGLEALQYAVWNGHSDCLKLLLDAGADVNSIINPDWGDVIQF